MASIFGVIRMADKFKVLQIGANSWASEVTMDADWLFIHCQSTKEEQQKIIDDYKAKLIEKKGKKAKLTPFDAVVISADISYMNLDLLKSYIDPFTILIDERIEIQTTDTKQFLETHFAYPVAMSEIESVIAIIAKDFFKGQSGAKLPIKDFMIRSNFMEYATYDGNNPIQIQDIHTDQYVQLGTWKYNIYITPERRLNLWFEYLKTTGLQFRLVAYFVENSGDIQKVQVFDENQMDDNITIETDRPMYVSISIEVKGHGDLSVGPLHYRHARGEFGEMLLGGHRDFDQKREEFFYYFNPGNLQPPLNVYFSGYRSAEGFEGYWMMKNLNKPFLLIADPRLEGGSFYIGTDEFEMKIENKIREALDYLGFSNEQLLLSGLSMGTYGALYYGARLNAQAIVVGKPLTSIGNIAQKLPLSRPDAFETSLDIVNRNAVANEDKYDSLNERIAPYLTGAHFPKNAVIAIAYMLHDEYDDKAYMDILEYLKGQQVEILSKGFVGRHNDNSPGINQWFYAQIVRILKTYFPEEGTDSE